MNKDSDLLIKAASELKFMIDHYNKHLMSQVRPGQESPPDLWDQETCQQLYNLAYKGSEPEIHSVYRMTKELLDKSPMVTIPQGVQILKQYCYQCDVGTSWLAPDGRCGDCTGYTPEQIRGDV
jgi:hypothetical protein